MSFKYNAIGSIGFSNILETILKNKGIENVVAFLNPTEKFLEDEFLYDNIEKARDCLVEHITNNSNIVIVVDTDVDGNTSAAMMYQYIKRIKSDIHIEFIIHDGKEHGLDKKTLEFILQKKFNLVILPDAGSNDGKALETLSKANIDCIVLDHHEINTHTKFGIIVNNQSSLRILNKTITGVGVVYKFCKVLDKFYNTKYADDYLDLVALGMIADSCDLRNIESRYLVNKGLEEISENKNKNKFISELIKSQAYSMKNTVNIIGVAFYISPLINSLIRIGSQDDKITMFKAFCNLDELVHTKIRGQGEVDIPIQEYVRRACENSRRKQKKVVEDNVDLLSAQIQEYRLDKLPVLVCNASNDVDKNFTGLIANKLASKYQQPCLLLREETNHYSGSGRGFDKCSIKDFKSWCNNCKLFKYAVGHSQAFGASLPKYNIDSLYSILQKIEHSDELIYEVDGVFNDKNLSKEAILAVAKHKNVWGTTVDEPIFAIENIIVNTSEIGLIGKNQNTIKFTFHNIEFVMFNTNEKIYNEILFCGDSVKFTIIGRFDINDYNNVKTSQVVIEDMIFEKTSEIKRFRF